MCVSIHAIAAPPTAVAIANTVMGGLLSLSRGFHAWRDAQRQREWRGGWGAGYPLRGRDLAGQKAVIFGRSR